MVDTKLLAAPPALTDAGGDRRVNKRAEKLFGGALASAGIAIIVILIAIGAFLVAQSLPAILADGDLPSGASNFWAYVWPLAFGTLWSAFLALTIATPLAISVALFISHYAPRRLATLTGQAIDLLAAVPSVVFGLWGILVLAPAAVPIYSWLVENLGWIPLFTGPASATGRTIFTAAVVLAIMILPIMTAICRELFLATPRLTQEAALALGATKWEMIRTSVLPEARSGIVSAILLGLARALGETMAVAMVLSPALVVHFALLTPSNPSTIASNIALQFPESTGLGVSALLATGLVLFAITLVVNLAARLLTSRAGGNR